MVSLLCLFSLFLLSNYFSVNHCRKLLIVFKHVFPKDSTTTFFYATAVQGINSDIVLLTNLQTFPILLIFLLISFIAKEKNCFSGPESNSESHIPFGFHVLAVSCGLEQFFSLSLLITTFIFLRQAIYFANCP